MAVAFPHPPNIHQCVELTQGKALPYFSAFIGSSSALMPVLRQPVTSKLIYAGLLPGTHLTSH